MTAEPHPAPMTERNRAWLEDASHENGNYNNLCAGCGATFVGHKRRITCKACADDLAALKVSCVVPAPSGQPVEGTIAAELGSREFYILESASWQRIAKEWQTKATAAQAALEARDHEIGRLVAQIEERDARIDLLETARRARGAAYKAIITTEGDKIEAAITLLSIKPRPLLSGTPHWEAVETVLRAFSELSDQYDGFAALAEEVIRPFAKIADAVDEADEVSRRHHADEGRSWAPRDDYSPIFYPSGLVVKVFRKAREFLQRTGG